MHIPYISAEVNFFHISLKGTFPKCTSGKWRIWQMAYFFIFFAEGEKFSHFLKGTLLKKEYYANGTFGKWNVG